MHSNLSSFYGAWLMDIGNINTETIKTIGTRLSIKHNGILKFKMELNYIPAYS